MLADEHRKTLLRIARESIDLALNGSYAALDPGDFHEELRRPSGAFVTLTTGGDELRGCIGSIHAIEPLVRAVSSSAIAAALRDPRFPPVRAHEMPGIHLEISVMGPIESVTDVADIAVGRDGLIIRRGRNAGLLLPQVATEYGWDLNTFLDHTCMKAGLPAGSWRHPDCRIERFSAEVFGERNYSFIKA